MLARLDLIIAYQKASINQETLDMATIDDAIATMTTEIEAQTTLVASLGPFIQGLFDQIAGTLSLTPAQIAALQDLQTKFEANDAAIAAAMVAHT